MSGKSLSWRDWMHLVREAPPGRRFERFYSLRRQQSSDWSRIASTAGGAVLCVAGAVMLVVPGPGLVVLALGALLLAQHSRLMARCLDAGELTVRAATERIKRLWNADDGTF